MRVFIGSIHNFKLKSLIVCSKGFSAGALIAVTKFKALDKHDLKRSGLERGYNVNQVSFLILISPALKQQQNFVKIDELNIHICFDDYYLNKKIRRGYLLGWIRTFNPPCYFIVTIEGFLLSLVFNWFYFLLNLNSIKFEYIF